jgi:hypothetical protein
MFLIEVKTKDEIIKMPIEKALLIPELAKQIKQPANRNYYLNQIMQSNYNRNELISMLNLMKD